MIVSWHGGEHSLYRFAQNAVNAGRRASYHIVVPPELQLRIRRISRAESTTETSSDPAQPSRLEKKTNTFADHAH
jgi:hypothetical protein